jgi:hypothetical protein
VFFIPTVNLSRFIKSKENFPGARGSGSPWCPNKELERIPVPTATAVLWSASPKWQRSAFAQIGRQRNVEDILGDGRRFFDASFFN